MLCSYVPSNFLSTSRVVRTLGEGSYGKIQLILTEKGERYAVKEIPIEDDTFDKGISLSAISEIDNLIRLKNLPNILQIKGVCSGSLNTISPCNKPTIKPCTNIILEEMDFSLIHYINNSNFDTRLAEFDNLFKSVLRGKAYMETLGINHYDIKPDNILLRINKESKQIYFALSDFGLSRANFANYIIDGEVFSLWYRAPEFLAGRDQRTFNVFAGDSWSIGICMMIYILGGNPFAKPTADQILYAMQKYTNEANLTFIQFKEYLQRICSIKTQPIEFDKLDVQKIFREFLTPADYAKLPEDKIQNVQSLLVLDPNTRPTAGTVLRFVYRENISYPTLESVSTLKSVNRKITSSGIDLIYRLAVSCTMTTSATLMAIELFTRFLGLFVKNNPNLVIDGNYDLVILCCCRIANMYLEGTYRSYSKFIKSYISIQEFNSNNSVILTPTLNELYETETIMLTTIDYIIYNIELTPVVRTVYMKGSNITCVDKNIFTLPISNWTNYFK